MKTPLLSKVNRSLMGEERVNESFMTERQRGGLDQSDAGSIGVSSKASFNDSFRLPTDVSYEEEERMDGVDNVNSSMELQRHSFHPTNNCSLEMECKAMKKSTQIYCSSNYHTEQDVPENKSVTSMSSNPCTSINFSEKFKHYKRNLLKDRASNRERVVNLSQFELMKEIGSGKYGKVYLARHR